MLLATNWYPFVPYSPSPLITIFIFLSCCVTPNELNHLKYSVRRNYLYPGMKGLKVIQNNFLENKYP